MTGKAYTMKEMKAIVNYLVEHKAYGEIRGRKMWMDFASSKETTRTWQSLKETFLKRILPDINNPYYKLSLIQIASFKQASDVETKLQNKLNVEPVDKDISSNENGHSDITDVEVNTEKNLNIEERTLPGEEPLIPQIIMDNRASTETLVLEQCYETAEDIQKELEQSDKEEQSSKPANKGTETSIPIPPNLVQVLKDFASDDENNDELKQAETETSNKKKTQTELIVISDSEEKVKSSDQQITEQADIKAAKELENEKAGCNPKNTSNSILSENDAETVKNIKSNKEELPDKSKNLTQNSSNTTVDTQLPNNPEELNKNSDRGDLNKKSPASLSLNDRKRNMKRATSEDAPTKRAKIQQPVSDTDAVKNIKNNEVIIEQATNSEKQDQSNDAQIVNLDAPLDTNDKSAKIDENKSPVVEMQIPPQIENPCLKSVNLYEEQFSCTIYSDSDDVQIDKKIDSKKITESVLKPQTSKRKAMVINSNSNPSSTTEGQIKNKSVLRILEKKQRDKALAHTFGFSNNAAFGNRKRRHSYTKRRSTSRHRTLKISSDSSDSSSDTESEFISPPRARKNKGNKRYLKPKSARIHSLEEEGGLFVMHGKKIYPVVKDGKIMKNYLTYESDGHSDEDTSYWKLKYVEEKKKADELAKLLKQVKNSKTIENSVVPEATTTTDVDVCNENTKKHREMVKTSLEPTTSETKPTEQKEDRTVKIKITKNNEEVELEGHWTHINPVLQQVVQMMKKTGPSGSEKQMPPPGTEHATRGLRQSTSDPITLSGVSTPVDKVKNRINAIESEIFKEIEDLDKEAEPEPAVNQSNDTAQRRSSRQKKSPTKKASVTSPKTDIANKEDKPAEVPEVPVTRRSSRTSKQVLNENAATTRKRSPRKAQTTATSANPEVRYKLPARGKRPPRARYTIKTARIYSSPDNLSLNSEETTQGYVDTDGSPAICLRKKRKTSLSSRNDSNHIRKKSVPSITEDMSSESSISFVSAPLESKTFTNSSLSSQIYRSDSYQLLMPKNKNSPKHLDQIDELSIHSNDGEILHYKSKQASETDLNNFDIDINFNEINYNIDNDQYCNVSLPTSPVLSVVENMSVSKSLLSSISENYGDNPNFKVTLNELMSEADVSMPLMERNYTVKKKCEVGTKYHCSLQEPSITDSFINKICTVQIEDISDSISSKLRNLLIESTKKIVTKIKTGEDDKNLETAMVVEEPVVKTNKSKAKKRSSTPRKRPNVRKPKASIPDPYIEEHTEACSLAGRKSCPPIIHVTDVDKPIKDVQQNQEAQKVSTVKEKKKKDIIKVKITKPGNKRKSKVDYQDIIHTNEEHIPNGNGTNDTESGIFLQGLNDSVDLIHNHSDTCLQAHDCIDDHSVEIIEPSPTSIITIDSNSMNAEKDLSHYLHVNEQIALELMSNDAQDCTDLIKVLNSTKSKSIATTTASTLNTTAASPNSLITEDLSVENVLSGTPRSHNWYLLSEEENSTNFKELKNIEPISVSYGANLNHIFPNTYAVPNLSTVTEMSKDGDDTNSKNVNIA